MRYWPYLAVTCGFGWCRFWFVSLFIFRSFCSISVSYIMCCCCCCLCYRHYSLYYFRSVYLPVLVFIIGVLIVVLIFVVSVLLVASCCLGFRCVIHSVVVFVVILIIVCCCYFGCCSFVFCCLCLSRVSVMSGFTITILHLSESSINRWPTVTLSVIMLVGTYRS